MAVNVTVICDFVTNVATSFAATVTNTITAGLTTQTSTSMAGSASGVILPYGYVVLTDQPQLNVVCAVGTILGPTLDDLSETSSY
jgi:hypothetical protein